MRVSVLISSYNYENYVGECIESVLRQSQLPDEVIVVDDASTDRSVDIIASKLNGSRCKTALIVNEVNRGQAETLNRAYREATGDLICLLDSDDYWSPSKLERVCRFVSEYPDGGVYQHQLSTSTGFKRNGLLSADMFDLWKSWDNGTFNLADSYDGIFFSPFLPTSGLCFRRTVLDRVFPIPQEIVTCPDAFLTRTAVAFGPLYSIPETLGVWRDHGRNAGLQSDNSLFNHWLPTVLPALNEFYRENGLGLQLIFDKRKKSFVPAARMLGECGPFEQDPGAGTIRTQLNRGRNRFTILIGELLRLVVPERRIQSLKRFVE